MFLGILATAMLQGIIGSLHCLGMCGPFVMVMHSTGRSANGPGNVGNRVLASFLYNVGRSISYMTVGAVLGALGQGLNMASIDYVNNLAAYVGGVFIIILAISYAMSGTKSLNQGYLQGKLDTLLRPFTRMVSGRIRSIQAASNSEPKSEYDSESGGSNNSARIRVAVLLGMMSGLLPCGLLYPAYTLALSTGSPAYAALVMLAFSLGTYPALFSVGLLSGEVWKRLSKREWKLTMAGLLMAIGLGTIYFRTAMPHHHGGHAEHMQPGAVKQMEIHSGHSQPAGHSGHKMGGNHH